jgi:hypothetical protein
MTDLQDPRPRVGRRLALTAEVFDRIVSAVKGGSYLDDAAAYAGISERTLYLWLARGREAEQALEEGQPLTDDEALLLQFSQAIQKARADAVIRNVTLIQNAAQQGSWQAAAWYLERTNPRKWGRTETVEIGIPEERQIEPSDIAALLDQRIQRMRERSQGIIEAEAIESPDQEPPSLQIAR